MDKKIRRISYQYIIAIGVIVGILSLFTYSYIQSSKRRLIRYDIETYAMLVNLYAGRGTTAEYLIIDPVKIKDLSPSCIGWIEGMKFKAYVNSKNHEEYDIDFSRPVFLKNETLAFVKGTIRNRSLGSVIRYKYQVSDKEYSVEQILDDKITIKSSFHSGDSVLVEYRIDRPDISRLVIDYNDYVLD